MQVRMERSILDIIVENSKQSKTVTVYSISMNNLYKQPL
jgi:hypothetical protein